MSILGIDVGTTGCKAATFSAAGSLLAQAYEEYDMLSPNAGWAELDAAAMWEAVKRVISKAVAQTARDPVSALAVTSLGEAMVPVSRDRRILGAPILNFDVRGEEYLEGLRARLPDERLYSLNGNTLGNHYSLTKLMWVRDHLPALYERTYKLLHVSAFVAFMLGAEPAVDYSLANRSLLFDLDRKDWSDELIQLAGLDRGKLPALVPSDQPVGTVSRDLAEQLGLPPGVAIVAGAHDQCANAMGCGVIDAGTAVYGMGSFHCITPVFSERHEPSAMIARGLNTEHHAAPGQYVCFIYNQGGTYFKWFRNTFAAVEHAAAQQAGKSIYPALLSEMPEKPSSIIVLPHFAQTGPPQFLSDTCGVMVGLHLSTSRGDILKGILEGITLYLKEVVDSLPATGIAIREYRAAGGGSVSDTWVQICADILGKPFARPAVAEAGALGAAILAGVGSGVFASSQDGVGAMVHLERTFEPSSAQQKRYEARFEEYRRLYPMARGYLTGLHNANHRGEA